MMSTDLKDALQFLEPTPNLLNGLQTLKTILVLERAYAKPSLKPEEQLAVHAELGFSMGQIQLLDSILEALSNPQLNETAAE